MALDIPDLDDRTYADIVEDARKRIPVHSDEWTDHNAHDPGITILETLAWLAETYSYQLDRSTERHLRKYLRLLGRPPKSPQSATVPVRLTLPEGLDGTRIPERTKLTVEDELGTKQTFETTEAIYLTAATIARVFAAHRQGQTDNTTANETSGLSFSAFGDRAEWGSSLYLGFDADPFAVSDRLTLSMDYDETDVHPQASHGDETLEFEPSLDLRWEYCTDCSAWYESASWAPLAVVADGTTRLYHGGTVTLERRSDASFDAGSVLDAEGSFRWLRCTVVRLDDVADSISPTSIGACPPTKSAGAAGSPTLRDGDTSAASDAADERRSNVSYEVPPRLVAVATNVVFAVHEATVKEKTTLVRSDGGETTSAWPGQEFAFPTHPVLSATITVGGERWTGRPDFDASGPDDETFVLDRSRGVVRFGDGVRGTVPEPDQTVEATAYTVGGGEDGNVPRSDDWAFAAPELRKEGVYTYHSEYTTGMKGAIVVGEPDGSLDLNDWFADPTGEPDVTDKRGTGSVTVKIGAEDDDGHAAFDPRAVRIDPGTEVRFVWESSGHGVVVDDQPVAGEWFGHPTPELAGHEYRHYFQPSVALDTLSVEATEDASGGQDAESVTTAFQELKRDLRTPYRAVSLDDCEYVAENTPGLRFGRTKALIESRSRVGDCEPHDRVVVVVVPFSPLDKPEPSDGFLDAVERHLCKHTLLTDRVGVRPPTYVGVGVDAEIRIESGYTVAGRTDAVERELREFLHPLDGFDGTGWPFGRALYRSELYECIEGVEGVDCVHDLSIRAQDDYRREDDAVTIADDVLLYSLDHDVAVRDDRDECGRGF